jgi:pyridinium-3,5-bisthiocarboxylic acid mononucleotide nickel chelatase
VHGDREGASERPDLRRGEGAGCVLFLDAPSGLSGDMIIAALVDLGVPRTAVAEAAGAVGISGYHLHFGERARSGIAATSFEVHVDEAQPERTYGAIRRLLDESALSEPVRARAHATFRKLAEAEARVHHRPLDDVHFHEVGAIDAIVDVVGSAAALDWIGAELVVSPLPLGRGYVNARHGKLPLPPPAVLECLRSFPTYDGGLDFEFVTPTGAAIVAAHARGSVRWPAMAPDRVGWGAGTAELADRPNLLRAVLGGPGAGVATDDTPTHVVLETNIDDATGELLGAAMEAVMAAGALDVWASPATMKKGRPGWVLSAVSTAPLAERIAGVVLEETTSIGVRRYPVSRLERPRRMLEVQTRFGKIPVKVSGGAFGPPQVKPEFDACLQAARAHRVPVREVVRAAVAASLELAAVGP